jgi:hypothetical protein
MVVLVDRFIFNPSHKTSEANKTKVRVVAFVTLLSIVAVAGVQYIIDVYNPRSYTTLPEYACPEDMPASECSQLDLTCGNGITDPGEDCQNCAFDAGCPSGLVCGNIGGGEEITCHYPAGLCLASPVD